MKKGNMVLEGLAVILVIGVLGIFFFTMANVQTELNTNIQNQTSLTNQSKQISQTNTDNFPKILDSAIITVLIMIWFGALISAWFIDEHPIFLIITFILFIIVLIAAAFVQSGIQGTIEDSDFSEQYTTMPITTWLINNLLILVLVIGLSVSLVLYLRFSK